MGSGGIGVYLYDLTTNQERKINSSNFGTVSPNIWNNRIVWQEGRNRPYQIFLYDLSTQIEKQISNPPAAQSSLAVSPFVSGNIVVWQDNRNDPNHYDIYGYNISADQEFPLIKNFAASQVEPVINDKYITWKSIAANGNYELFVAILPQGQPNRPPVFSSVPDQTVNEGQVLTFTVSATDPDGDSLTYSASNLPSGASFNPGNQIFSWTPNFTQAGIYSVTFTATDGIDSAQDTVLMTVNNVNLPPAAVSIRPSSGSGPARAKFPFTGTYADPDGWQDLQTAHLIVNTAATGVNGVHAYYDKMKNRIFLRNDNGTAWMGGFAPGSNNTIQNSQVILYCAGITISGSGNSMSVRWPLTFNPTFKGNKNIYLKASDNSNAESPWQKKGSWTIT